RITINGKTYRGVEEMPPDVRETYERVMANPTAPGGSVKKNEVFFSFGISRGARPQPGASGPSTGTAPTPLPPMSPTEPAGAQTRVQALFVFLAGALAAGLAFWIFRTR